MSDKKCENFSKVDRALEMQVIDWLQWSDFPEDISKRPDDSDMAQLTLTLLSKRKQAHTDALEMCEKLAGALEDLYVVSECSAYESCRFNPNGSEYFCERHFNPAKILEEYESFKEHLK